MPRNNAFERRLSLHRCLKALNFSIPDDLLGIIGSDEEHYFAREEIARNGEQTLRVHMSGTKNSRRFVHVYLWWTIFLGPFYPISDHLLRGHVWKHLRCVCGSGIVDTRGHHKTPRVCINPHHYKMENSVDLFAILLDDVRNLVCVEKGEAWIVSSDATGFLKKLQEFVSKGCDLFGLATFIRSNCPVFACRNSDGTDSCIHMREEWDSILAKNIEDMFVSPPHLKSSTLVAASAQAGSTVKSSSPASGEQEYDGLDDEDDSPDGKRQRLVVPQPRLVASASKSDGERADAPANAVLPKATSTAPAPKRQQHAFKSATAAKATAHHNPTPTAAPSAQGLDPYRLHAGSAADSIPPLIPSALRSPMAAQMAAFTQMQQQQQQQQYPPQMIVNPQAQLQYGYPGGTGWPGYMPPGAPMTYNPWMMQPPHSAFGMWQDPMSVRAMMAAGMPSTGMPQGSIPQGSMPQGTMPQASMVPGLHQQGALAAASMPPCAMHALSQAHAHQLSAMGGGYNHGLHAASTSAPPQ